MSTLQQVFQTVILFGAVQGLVFSILLFVNARKVRHRVPDLRLSNRLMGVLLLLISVASLKVYGDMVGWSDINFFRLLEDFVPFIIVMPVGPLVFFYVRSSIDPANRLSKEDRRHFYPVIIDFVPQLIAIIFVIGMILHLKTGAPGPWANLIDQYNVYSDIPRWISITLYIWMARRLLVTVPVERRTPQWKWLRQFLTLFSVFQVIWLLYLIPYVIPAYTDVLLNKFNWYPVYVPLALLVYCFGIRGYLVAQQQMGQITTSHLQTPLPPDLIKHVANRLHEAMEKEQLYLNPGLTLNLLSQHTGIAAKQLSAVLNQHLHKSFNTFINEYRIHAIRQRLLSDDIEKQTIAGLAYDCGFNSLPTFQRAFKTVTGTTPTEFLSNQA